MLEKRVFKDIYEFFISSISASEIEQPLYLKAYSAASNIFGTLISNNPFLYAIYASSVERMTLCSLK